MDDSTLDMMCATRERDVCSRCLAIQPLLHTPKRHLLYP
jgi:hypothetical protein